MQNNYYRRSLRKSELSQPVISGRQHGYSPLNSNYDIVTEDFSALVDIGLHLPETTSEG
jgi:hypothetical protein